jgi:tetratricopeptide (TPR) repeat protein
VKKKAAIQLIIIVLLTATLHAQCISKDSINKDSKRINALPKSQSREKLVKLIEYQNIFKKCFSTTDSAYTSLLRKIGWTYFDMSDYFNAAEHFKQFIDIINSNANSPAVRLKDLISGYYWLSTFYDSLNNVTEKINAANGCIEISSKMNDLSNASFILSYMQQLNIISISGNITHVCLLQKGAKSMRWKMRQRLAIVMLRKK